MQQVVIPRFVVHEGAVCMDSGGSCVRLVLEALVAHVADLVLSATSIMHFKVGRGSQHV